MTDEEKYQSLKSNMINAYTKYIAFLQKSDLHDLLFHKNTIQLSDEYIRTVSTSVLFNDFVRSYVKRKKEVR